MKTFSNLNQLKYTVQKLATVESLKSAGQEINGHERVVVDGIEYVAEGASQDLTDDILEQQPERSKHVHYALRQGGVFMLGEESESPCYRHEFRSDAGELSQCKVTHGHGQHGAFWQIEIMVQDGDRLVVDKMEIPAQSIDS